MYSLIEIEKGNIQTHMFYADASTDIANLPTKTAKGSNGDGPVPPGSKCWIINEGKIYILNHANTWTEF